MSSVSAFDIAVLITSVGFLILCRGVSLYLMARAGRECNHSRRTS
jgi:hypothetical protein